MKIDREDARQALLLTLQPVFIITQCICAGCFSIMYYIINLIVLLLLSIWNLLLAIISF
ncbi:hypothetical protein LCGC14_2483330, partial [marine sediment metagenome]